MPRTSLPAPTRAFNRALRRPSIAAFSRLLAAALVASLAVAFSSAAPTAANQAPTEPEARLLSLINQERQAVGRVPLQWDSRLADIAQWRSDDMVANNYFGHIAWERITKKMDAKGITWYYLGETLVHGTPRTPLESADEAMVTWRNSQGHWDLLSSEEFNYVAIGMARASDGWYKWTALLLKGPDRTAPTANMTSADVGKTSSTLRSVTVSWTGSDVPLSMLTAGLRDFRLQRKTGSGVWTTVPWTSDTSKRFDLATGKEHRFRVRARDRNGNLSVWSAPLVVVP